MFVVDPVCFGDDPIFALNREAAQRIARGLPCINATIGMLMDDQGKLAVLPTLVETLRAQQPSEWAGYASTRGPDAFCEGVLQDALGAWPRLHANAMAVATPGATGAIRSAMVAFLERGQACLTASLCWGTYAIIAQAAGRRLTEFELLREDGWFDVDDLDRKLMQLLATQGRALVVLNDPCHNPTGYSMTAADWLATAEVLRRRSAQGPITLLLDASYAAYSPDANNHAFAALSPLANDILITLAWSASKTYACYGLRAGALISVAPDRPERDALRDTLTFHACGTWANCNHAAMLAIARLLREPTLGAAAARERAVLIDLLARRSAAFRAAATGTSLRLPRYSGGFFTCLFVNEVERVAARLRGEGIYVVPMKSGLRVALSAVSTRDVPRLVAALAEATGEVDDVDTIGSAVCP